MAFDITQYKFVVTSANESEYLTLECTDESKNPPMLLIEAELINYKTCEVSIKQHKENLSLELMEEFVRRTRYEIENGGNTDAT
ncbi:hypothetical protein MNBD_GAMMA11-3407 [hydrothermal vent metagenome]|uniref:Uncharacterized protein n=1 Tax=hydrothermal vent metagenome TaxID=652676 RepID=A0A3B0WWM7_9ZZZZ